MPDVDATAVAGVEQRGYRRGALSTDGWDPYVIPVEDKIVTFRGRSATFVTPGRAAVTQRLFAIHNATTSPVLVSVNRIIVDVLVTAVKAVTVVTPLIRLHRFTALPTGGTALGKVALDSSLTSSTGVTVYGDSSADGTAQAGTLSATALAITPIVPPIAQVEGPRVFTAVGYELVDTAQFLIGEPDVILRPLEGVCVSLDQAVVTTGNPATDKWTAFMDWTEYTRP